MNDLDQTLRSDAERWQARLRPVTNLDEQLAAALSRPRPSRHPALSVLAAAVVVAIAVAVAAINLSGTHREQSGAAEDLAQITGVVWKDPGSPATVVYTKATMRLFDGCTNQLAHLVVEHRALVQGKSIGQVGTCTGPAMLPGSEGDAQRAQQARLAHFYAVIAGPASWSRSGDILTLTTQGKGTLHLSTNRARAPMLTGTSWRLAYYVGADGREYPALSPVRLTVEDDGSFTAGLSCGGLIGTAHVSLQTIRIDTVSRTSCAAGPDPASRVVLDLVGAGDEDSYAIRGTELMVYSKSHGMLIYQS